MNTKANIAIVVSRFNTDITEGLLQGAKECAVKEGLNVNEIETYIVPGAFELPFMAKKLADTSNYDARCSDYVWGFNL